MSGVARLIPKAAGAKPATKEAARRVHELRVATRRAASVLHVFEPVVKDKEAARAVKALKKIRRVCGRVRDCDVRKEIFEHLAKGGKDEASREIGREIIAGINKRRKEAWPKVAAMRDRWPKDKMRRRIEKLIAGIEPVESGADAEATFGLLAEHAVREAVGEARAAAERDLSTIEHAHQLRIALKHVRYALEAARACIAKTEWSGLRETLVGLQGTLGGVNDAAMVVDEIEVFLEARRGSGGKDRRAGTDAAGRLLRLAKERLKSEHQAFMRAWRMLDPEAFFARLENAIRQGVESALSAKMTPEEHSSPRVLRPTELVEVKDAPAQRARSNGTRDRGLKRRIAAIDVGTNSVRLIVAEGQADGSYRVLDDEKEITRLGKGLHETGRMDEQSIEHTAVTIARMKSIAEGYGAREIRVVATAAAREAKNGETLLRLVRERSGLSMQVVSGEEEAMLAYRSAANAFDLSAAPSAVFDVGGGSTEIILSAGAGAGVRRLGVIERVYSLPIGAVRLTEMFGGPEACSGERFEEMREYVLGLIKREVKKGPPPQVFIGTGGTLTTLGAILKLKELGASASGLFGGVQGQEVGRADLKHLIANLRKLPVKERTKIAGLSADRADIIVAGLVIVDCVLKCLGGNRVKIHEGGIRDGILLGMLRRGDEIADAALDPMKSVRRFAKACSYEAAHSKHVTMLALQMYDQLGQQTESLKGKGLRFDAEARLLLEAAAFLHDVGYLINYAQHHKHSYHLIVHADLPGLSVRQVQVIANVARYHRAGEPKEKHEAFAMLGESDRKLVRQLAGILRVADGLDRTHTQSVDKVELRVESKHAHVLVHSRVEPSVDMWGAMRKGGLFQRVFGVSMHLDWASVSEPSGQTVSKLEMKNA